ncbi:MAG: response regulator [Chloroflexi bacterium]|nr:response regulator [Chloroflexota bacterium]
MPKTDTIGVLIVDDIPDTHENLKKLLYFEKDIEVVGTAMNGTQAIELAKQLEPDVILMDINMPGVDGIATTEAILAERVNSQIIMMSIQGETDYLRRSMLAGAREFLIKPFSGEELASSIRRVHSLRVERALRPVEPGPNGHGTATTTKTQGKVISAFSPKGGVGRTTIISNLAIALKELTQKKVVLVDCNLQFGDVGVLFNIQSPKTIIDLVSHLSNLDEDVIEDVLIEHSSGVKLLLGPPRPEMGELVTAEGVKIILNKLRETYDYILVDTLPSFQDQMVSVLDLSDHILVVLTLELPAIKNVKLFLEVADALGYPPEKVALILNRADSTGGIRVSDVESSLRKQIMVSIVSDGRLATLALNQGVPFVISSKGSPVSKGIFSLARLVGEIDAKTAAAAQAPSSKAGLGKLAQSLHFKRA